MAAVVRLSEIFNQNSIQFHACGSWHHIECQGMRTETDEIMANHSWNCINCGLPNFRTTLFDGSLSSFGSSNSFRILDASHLRITSSPSEASPKNRQPQSKLKILNINSQSIVNKVQEFWSLVETEKRLWVLNHGCTRRHLIARSFHQGTLLFEEIGNH